MKKHSGVSKIVFVFKTIADREAFVVVLFESNMYDLIKHINVISQNPSREPGDGTIIVTRGAVGHNSNNNNNSSSSSNISYLALATQKIVRRIIGYAPDWPDTTGQVCISGTS